MSHNGKDASGNSFKFSLIPLMLGIVVIFFLYRSCGNSAFQPEPSKGTNTVVLEEEVLSPEQPIVKQDTASTAVTTVAEPVAETVAQDTLQAAK